MQTNVCMCFMSMLISVTCFFYVTKRDEIEESFFQHTKAPKKAPSRGQKKRNKHPLSHTFRQIWKIISLFTSLFLFLSSRRGPHLRILSRRGKKKRAFFVWCFLTPTISLFFSHIESLKTGKKRSENGFRIGSD